MVGLRRESEKKKEEMGGRSEGVPFQKKNSHSNAGSDDQKTAALFNSLLPFSFCQISQTVVPVGSSSKKEGDRDENILIHMAAAVVARVGNNTGPG